MRIETYADRAPGNARVSDTAGRPDFETIGLGSNSYIVAVTGTRPPGGSMKIIRRSVADDTLR